MNLLLPARHHYHHGQSLPFRLGGLIAG